MFRCQFRAISGLAAAALAIAGPAPLLAQGHADHIEQTEFAPETIGAEYMVMEITANEAASKPFLRGLALLHNFEYSFAAKEFRKAQEADPDFVMAYWGEAMTHNHPLWAQQDREKALEILERLGATPSDRAAKARNAKEREWLGTIETLYGTSGEVGSKIERDHAYLAALRTMLDAYPEDIDVRAFTGLAVLGSSHGGRQTEIYMQAAGVLEPGFMTHERHPGILHYLIHSYDDPVHAPLGERMAERYAVVAPDAGHAQHMVSHIFLALADWPATELANVNAANVVNRQREAQGRDQTSCGHYNEWLAYALLQQGKDGGELIRKCVAQVRELVANGDEIGFRRGSWSAARVSLFLGIDEGEWLEPIDFPETKETGSARFVQAHAALMRWHQSDLAKAKQAVADMKRIYAEMGDSVVRNGDTSYRDWLDRTVERGEALIQIAEGDRENGLAALEQAAAAELALPVVFGPPVIFKPSYEILGEMHLAEGRLEEAAACFEKSLRLSPGRRLSLEGLKAAQGG
jgi:tetratricopeptide (TPR) repeat protein